jgi:hypothetical protein
MRKANGNTNEASEQFTNETRDDAEKGRAEEVVTENVNEVDEELELLQEDACAVRHALGEEILSAIARLGELYGRVVALPVYELDRGDIDGDDAGTLYAVQMLEPVEEDIESDILAIIVDQGNIWGDGGETFIGWAIADVEARVDQIETDIKARTEVQS